MTILSGILNLVYPAVCGICSKKLLNNQEPSPCTQGLGICKDCFNKIRRNLAPYCKYCGRSLEGLVDSVEVCWECSKRKFYYEKSWSCFLYEGVIKEALHLLKYSKKFSLTNLFCGLLIQFVTKNPEIIRDIDAILAVPLHSIKLREREFNQAHLLTTAIIKEFNINPDFSLEKSAPSDSEGLQDQTRREFGRFCRVSQILQLHKIVPACFAGRKNPGLPRKIGKSSSDLPNDPFGANFAIAKFGIKDLSRCLRRSVATRPQSELDKNQRFDNVKGTFEVVDPQLLYGKNLLIVDDVFTTGATLNECAKVLKKAGAKKIHCFTFARGI